MKELSYLDVVDLQKKEQPSAFSVEFINQMRERSIQRKRMSAAEFCQDCDNERVALGMLPRHSAAIPYAEKMQRYYAEHEVGQPQIDGHCLQNVQSLQRKTYLARALQFLITKMQVLCDVLDSRHQAKTTSDEAH